VIHQLTALPKTGPRRVSDLEPLNRLRDEGTRNLLHAAIAAGAQRLVAGSFGLPGASRETATNGEEVDRAAAAVKSMESQMLDAARRGAIMLIGAPVSRDAFLPYEDATV